MLLVIAMVMSAALVKAYEQGKAQAKTRWDEARRRAEERGAQREREQQERAAAWSAWFDRGVSSGPRHPLWWVYAAGWTTGGAMAALGAGAVGVYSGAVAGGKSGYRLGATAGKQGRKYREAFREWRRTNRGKGETVELEVCGRCEGWIAKSELVASTEYWQVCPDCAPDPVRPRRDGDKPDVDEDRVHERRSEETSPLKCPGCGRSSTTGAELCPVCQIERAQKRRAREQRAQERRTRCNGRCRNSSNGPTEARIRGLCPVCGGLGELITDFGGEHKHVTCSSCGGSGKDSGSSHEESPQDRGPIRATAERVYPEREEETQPKEITNTMAELMPANSSEVAATGEGLTDTLRTLKALASLLTKAHDEMTGLGDNLTANSLDAETLNRISDLNDLLDTAAPMAQELHRHVENRHNPVADAMAAAGGSGNVATKTFYDDH